MIAYTDFAYYVQEYGGTRITDQADYQEAARAAARLLDQATLYRARDMDADMIRDCACAMADCWMELRDRKGVASENNDGYSVSYDTDTTVEDEMMRICRDYLSHTGLLFRGA